MMHRQVVHVIVLPSSLLSLFIKNQLQSFDVILLTFALLEDIRLETQSQLEQLLTLIIDNSQLIKLLINGLDIGCEC